MNEHSLVIGLGERAYSIVIGPLDAVPAIAAWRQTVEQSASLLIVTDRNVAAAGPLAALQRFLGANRRDAVPVCRLEPGEAHKTFAAVELICREAARRRLDRASLLLALGGGVAGDLTGFAAAVYMRGIDFIQIPTTLLAMVDSSVGGKTGADLPEGKNLIGAFHQPRLVLIDPAFLKSLPGREIRAGLAEVVKTAVLFDPVLFDYIADRADALLAADGAAFLPLIRRCCELKGAVVVADEREKGRRALLNYGHTFGHAIEKETGFRVSHGEAVAIGMDLAARLAAALGMLPAEAVEKQRRLLRRLGLPTELPAGLTAPAIYQAMLGDKKNISGRLKLILPSAIGSAEICDEVPAETILKVLS